MTINRYFVVFRRMLMLSVVVLLTLANVPISHAAPTPSRPYIELVRPDRGRVFAVTWSPDGRYVAVGTDSGLWIYTDTLADVTHIADEPIHALAWSPDGKTIAAGYFGKKGSPNNNDKHIFPIVGGGLRIWSASQVGETLHLSLQNKIFADGSVYALRFNPSGTMLAALTQDTLFYADCCLYGQDTLHIYNAKSTKQYTFVLASTSIVQTDQIVQSANGLSWSHTGRYLAIARGHLDAGDEGCPVCGPAGSVWDAVTNRFLRIEQVSGAGDVAPPAVGGIAWSRDDSQLATTTEPTNIPNTESDIRVCVFPYGTACVYPTTSQDAVRTLDPFVPEQIQTLAWQPNGDWLAYDGDYSPA